MHTKQRIHQIIQGTFIALLALTLTSSLFPIRVHAASAAYGNCQNTTLPVAMSAGQAKDQTIAGTYCTPATWATSAHAVDVLVHGATYNRSYWDWPQDPALYSYVDKDLQAGRAVFYYDRIGAGQSSHPNGLSITAQTDAYTLHQIIQWFKTSQDYTTVNVIGHSMGAVVAAEEAGVYNDASKLVLTSMLHVPAIGQSIITLSAGMYPAALDPQFSGSGILDGYLTTRPGIRSTTFYGPSNVDPAVTAYDEAHKDLFADSELTTGVTALELPPILSTASHITAPVLVVVGAQDSLFCGGLIGCTNANAVRANESLYYLSAAKLDVISVPATGHDLTLHTTAPQSFASINNWIRQN